MDNFNMLAANRKKIAKMRQNNVIPITLDTINNKVPCIQIYLQNEVNMKLQEYHQELLRIAMQRHDYPSGEMLMLIDMFRDKFIIIPGDFHSVNVSKDINWINMVNNAASYSLTVIHNHPSTSTFSYKDLRTFTIENALFNMTAIANTGKIYYLEKQISFDKVTALEFIRSSYKTYTNEIDVVKNILDNADTIGFNYYTSEKQEVNKK